MRRARSCWRFVGLVAQLIDGSLGMAYGVTSSTLLSPPASPRPPPRPPSTSPRSAPRWSPGSPTTSSATSTGGPSAILARARLRRRLRRRDASCPASTRRHGQALGRRRSCSALGTYVICRFLALGGAPPDVQATACRAVFLAPLGVVAGAARRHRRRRLGPGRHHVAALLRPARAAQGGRLDRHLGVRGRGRRLARASCSRSAPRASTSATPAALLVGGVLAAPFAAWLVQHLAAPGARRRGRRADRAHQHRHHRRRPSAAPVPSSSRWPSSSPRSG